MNSILVRTAFVVIALMSITTFGSLDHARAEMAMGSISSQAGDNSKLDSQLAALYEIYANFKPIEQTIREITEANGGKAPAQIEIVKTLETEFQQHVPSSALSPNASPRIDTEVANSDLIVMATPLTARSLPIQDRTFLFTEYEVRVDRVMSANPTGIVPGETIIVSRGGGEMIVNGILVKAIEPAFDQFVLNQQYIFFLHSIRGTNSFRALGSGTFIIENGTVTTVSHLQRKREQTQDLNRFLNQVSDAIARKNFGRS